MTRCVCETVMSCSYEPIWVIIDTSGSDSRILSPQRRCQEDRIHNTKAEILWCSLMSLLEAQGEMIEGLKETDAGMKRDK